MAQLLLGALDLLAAPFSAQVGTSWGKWAALTTTQASLFVDGSVVSGDSTGNREVVLQVVIKESSRPALVEACEALIAEANRPANTLTWVPDDGPSSVYEVFRADGPTRVDDESEAFLRREYELHLPARPFVRSDVREQASAAPPGVPVDDMETVATGVVMGQQVPGLFIAGWGNVATAAPTVDASVAPVARFAFGSVLAAVTVTGGSAAAATASPAAVSVTRVTASAAGTVLVKTAAAFATAADYITVDWAAVLNASTNVPRSYQAGVEWLDAADLVVRTDWGPVSSFATGGISSPRAVWQASPRPESATKVRALLRITATAASEQYDIYAVTLQPSTAGTVTPSGPHHDGVAALTVQAANLTSNESGSGATFYYVYRAGMYARRVLLASLDISGESRLRAWLQTSGSFENSDPTIRLWDSAGHWSRYAVASLASGFPTSTWMLVGADLASPTESSPTPCDLADVVAYDVMATAITSADYNVSPVSMSVTLDTVTAGPPDSPNLTPRGTVLTLDGIKGSARTTAAITVSAGTAMTDWLVACIDGTEGDPLLVVASNKATAGGGYAGVYSVLCGLSPATALTSPTCTVAQKIGGTTVATRVLTGIQPSGNRYVDFGAVELPLVDTPAENTDVTYEFTLAPASTAYAELLVVDVDASMAWLSSMTTARKVAIIDEPDALAALGRVWVGDLTDRTDGRAPLTPPVLSRPLQVQAPSTRLLVYSTTQAPSAMLSYWPRWLVEPTS